MECGETGFAKSVSFKIRRGQVIGIKGITQGSATPVTGSVTIERSSSSNIGDISIFGGFYAEGKLRRITFSGKFDEQRIQLSGTRGSRQCALTLSRVMLSASELKQREEEARRLAEEERKRQEEASTYIVMAVQKRLADLGYYPGSVDGVIGGKTRAAIKAYQSLANLEVTGEVSTGLLQRLKQETAALARPAPTVQQTPTVDLPQTTLIPPGIDFGQYHALVIGNNGYRSLPRLRTAVNDAKAAARLLEDHYGFRVTLLIDATRADILRALRKHREKRTDQDNLLVYYAGHGWLDKAAGRGYWWPVDAHENDETNWIDNAYITGAVRAMSAKHVMVVADSCYSGTLTRGIKVAVRSTGYLQRISRTKARTVLTSGGLEPVADSGGGNHSAFAKAFLDVLVENQGVLDGHRLFTLMRRPVMVNSDQTPEYGDIRKAGHDGGDFIFVRKK